MWEEILRMAVENGLWAVLFCGLLFYILKDGRAREHKYQSTIETLCNHLNKIEEVKDIADETLKNVKQKKCKQMVLPAKSGQDCCAETVNNVKCIVSGGEVAVSSAKSII